MLDFVVVDALLELSAERGDAPTALALGWMLSVPGVVSPIIGSTKVEHIEEACAATALQLSAEEIERLEAPYAPHPIHGHEQPSPRGMA